MSNEKQYFGNGTEKTFTDGGKILKLSFNSTDLINMMKATNEKGWINLNVTRRQTPSEKGATHCIYLDTWQPTTQQTTTTTDSATTEKFTAPPMPDLEDDSTIPF